MLQEGFSKILIIVIVLVALGGGVLIWQSSSSPEDEDANDKAYLKIISPNGGEVWQKGEENIIEWESNLSISAPIHIALRKEEVVSKNPYKEFNPETASPQLRIFNDSVYPYPLENNGNYTYKVLSDISSGENWQILIWTGDCDIWLLETEKTCYFDLSDEFFTIVNDDMADWQTYRNEEFGFEMRHPKNWQLLHVGTVISFEPPFSDLYFNIDKISSQSTVQEFLEGIDSDAISVIEQKNIQVDGHVAIQRHTSYSRAPKGEDSWTTYIENSTEHSITIVRLVGRPEVINEAVVSLYDQMLSTFKFLR